MTPDPTAPADSNPSAEDGILITFPKGLLGFPHLTAYRLVEPQDGYPLKFLQSVEDSSVYFTCIDPVVVKEDYTFPLGEEEAATLALETQSEALILTLVVIPADPHQMTTNLAGPLVINTRTLIGFQIILNTERFPLRYAVLPEALD